MLPFDLWATTELASTPDDFMLHHVSTGIRGRLICAHHIPPHLSKHGDHFDFTLQVMASGYQQLSVTEHGDDEHQSFLKCGEHQPHHRPGQRKKLLEMAPKLIIAALVMLLVIQHAYLSRKGCARAFATDYGRLSLLCGPTLTPRSLTSSRRHGQHHWVQRAEIRQSCADLRRLVRSGVGLE